MKKVKHFFYRIKRLLDWLPVIWNDCDFDYAFLLEILQFKLRKMAEWFESDKPNVESAPVTAKEIDDALAYLNRYQNHSYCDIDYVEFDLKHGLDSDDFFEWHNKFRTLPESAKEQWFNIGKQAEIEMHSDLMHFFDSVKTHIEGWWD